MIDKKIGYQFFESVATGLWLLIDFIWMKGFPIVSICMSPIVLMLFVVSGLKYDDQKRTDLLTLYAGMCWFLMNSLWILSEIYPNVRIIEFCKDVIFGFSIFFIFLSWRKSRREGGQFLTFKRI